MALIVSRHCHTTPSGDLHILYNALAPRPMRGNGRVVQLLESFRDPVDPELLWAKTPAARPVVERLVKNRLLVEAGLDERASWLGALLGDGHRKAPRQTRIHMAGMGAGRLMRALAGLEEPIAASLEPFSLTYQGPWGRKEWTALVAFLEQASRDYRRFDWLQHFVVTDGANLDEKTANSLRGYNLAFRVSGAADPKALVARLLGAKHRVLLSVTLEASTGVDELAELGASALQLRPSQAMFRAVPTDALMDRLRILKAELKEKGVSVYGDWDHVVLTHTRQRLPRPFYAAVEVSRDGYSVCGGEALPLGVGSRRKLSTQLKAAALPALPAACESCPVVGLCYGQAAGADGSAGEDSGLCRLVVAQWREFLRSDTGAQTPAVATSAAF